MTRQEALEVLRSERECAWAIKPPPTISGMQQVEDQLTTSRRGLLQQAYYRLQNNQHDNV